MEIQLKKELMQVLEDLQWLPLKPVQEKTIPNFLNNENLLVQAETGAGKTGAYLLPAIEQCDPFHDAFKVLIIAPTRELALQIQEETKRLTSYLPMHTALLIGGMDVEEQEAQLKRFPQIVIGTPGRIVYMMQEGSLDLSKVKTLVIDEADMILSTGQINELNMITNHLNSDVQTVCFSATLNDEVRSFVRQPYTEILLHETELNRNISSYYLITDDRYNALLMILKEQPVLSAVIFVNHRSDTVALCEKLQKQGYLSEAFSAYENERTRIRTMNRFKNGEIRLLVATDAAARGIDITDLSHIIHYDLPENETAWIHRSGRSGHQGNEGITLSLLKNEDLAEPTVRKIMEDSLPLPQGSGNPYDLHKPLIKEEKPDPAVIQIRINAGKDDKIRPKDIAGALSDIIPFEKIGRIEIHPHDSTVILLEDIDLSEISIKGKKRKIRRI